MSDLAAAPDIQVEAVLAAEARRVAAILAQDGAALAALLAPELSFVHTSGRGDDRAGVLFHFLERVRFLACDQSDVVVRMIGDAAVLTARARNHVRVLASGAESRFDAWITQVWRPQPEGWVLAAYQATRITEN